MEPRCKKVDDLDVIEPIKIDGPTLPAGCFHDAGYTALQVFDIYISRVVTGYRSQIFEDENGNRYVAPFPEGETKAVQYGASIKALAVYLSQFQLIPYNVYPIHIGRYIIPMKRGGCRPLRRWECYPGSKAYSVTIIGSPVTELNVTPCSL